MKRNLNFLFVFLFVFLYLSSCGKESNSQAEADNKTEGRFKMGQIRKPAAAGQFYTDDPVVLNKQLADFFKNAKKEPIPGGIVALIAPHAGYIYSGQVAAYAFKLLEGLSFETVVVISPSHVAYFPGASIYNGGAYETPLGTIPVDTTLAGKIAEQSERVFLSDKGHGFAGMRGEHALEVELPFLQTVLGKFKLVAIVIGDQDYATCEALGQALAKALEGENALIVASSDLSHFHPYSEAVRLDSIVINHVNAFDPEGLFEDLSSGVCEACGGSPIVAAMIGAKSLGADKAKVLKYANSGDVTGDKSGVVGYMAAVMYNSQANPKKEKMKAEVKKVGVSLGLSEEDKKVLLNIARKTIECKVKGEKLSEFRVESPILKENRGAFVTIKENGQLRGCIGYIEAIKPLYLTVQEMAEAAALNDPRFPPVSSEELDKLELEISVLTPLKKIKDINEIEIGKHGIILKKGYHQGVFLPQVATEQGWDRITFLEELCYKAGIHDKNCWKDKDAEIYIYSADVFSETHQGRR
ncbi:MAG: AmmeMemoRadiSam system protein B [candidate division Zixibacteria bacterium]|nr:AmmeMemoRadiSam system protein B [candidate division Zixibacteria bacterium]